MAFFNNKFFEIKNKGKIITLERARSLTDLPSFYDPLGRHNINSLYYCNSMLVYLKKKNYIDSFIFTGKFPRIENKKGKIY